MHRAAGGIEHQDGARVFERTVRDVDGLLEQFFLREVVLLRLFRRGFARFQEDFVRTADEVAALLLELGFAPRHLIPDAAQRVVGEELDDVARREELVADGQLAAVARRGGFLAHLLPLRWIVEILVDPADRLVLAPERLRARVVEEIEKTPAAPARAGREARTAKGDRTARLDRPPIRRTGS